MITLLGENINLVRPQRITKPLTFGAWKQRRALRTITKQLTRQEKLAIAASMGCKLIEKENHNG